MAVNEKIAICIPSLNEEATIGQTTRIIDQGLLDLNKEFLSVIVNADNHSQDQTKQIFLTTETIAKKSYISTPKGEVGKGRNLFNFFNFCQKHNIDYAATIDADIKTIKKDWIKKILDPLIKNKADFITPLYQRSRFEDSTTNNFAFPVVFGLFSQEVRQPIGGEFGFNKKVYKQFVARPKNTAAYHYGIDIFMTLTALSSDNRLKEVFLGEKIHNPSFPNLVMMSKQVMESTFFQLQFCQPNSIDDSYIKPKEKLNIIEEIPFKQKGEAKELLKRSLHTLKNNFKDYNDFKCQKELKEIIKNMKDSEEQWVSILAKFIKKALNDYPPKKLSELLSPIFVIRAVSFWLESEKLSAKQTEEKIYQLANKTRKRLIRLILAKNYKTRT